MELSRRRFLQNSAVLGAGLLASACTVPSITPSAEQPHTGVEKTPNIKPTSPTSSFIEEMAGLCDKPASECMDTVLAQTRTIADILAVGTKDASQLFIEHHGIEALQEGQLNSVYTQKSLYLIGNNQPEGIIYMPIVLGGEGVVDIEEAKAQFPFLFGEKPQSQYEAFIANQVEIFSDEEYLGMVKSVAEQGKENELNTAVHAFLQEYWFLFQGSVMERQLQKSFTDEKYKNVVLGAVNLYYLNDVFKPETE